MLRFCLGATGSASARAGTGGASGTQPSDPKMYVNVQESRLVLVEQLAVRQFLPKRLLGLASDLRRECDPLEILEIAEVGEAGVGDLSARTEVELFKTCQIFEVL